MPELIEDYGEEFKADHYGPASIQTRTYMPENKSNRQFYYHEFRDRCEFTYSEDCQVLNIYAPQNAEKCPAMPGDLLQRNPFSSSISVNFSSSDE